MRIGLDSKSKVTLVVNNLEIYSVQRTYNL